MKNIQSIKDESYMNDLHGNVHIKLSSDGVPCKLLIMEICTVPPPKYTLSNGVTDNKIN